ncbi:MAG: hypothetical protein ACTSXZ_00640 [Alphaproteobacteria bacterium]
MKKWLAVLLFISLFLLAAPVGDDEAARQREEAELRNKIFLANNARGDLAVLGGCVEAGEIAVDSGRVGSCRSDNPTNFLLGLPGAEPVVLDATQESNFEVEIDGWRVLGARETYHGLTPGVEVYFVYVWWIGEGAE